MKDADDEEIEINEAETSFDKFVAVWDVGNNDIYGQIEPHLNELCDLLDQIAAAHARLYLPQNMAEAVAEHFVDGECVSSLAALCGCLAELPEVDVSREDCDESSGTWPYMYYSGDTRFVVETLRKSFLAAIAAAPDSEPECPVCCEHNCEHEIGYWSEDDSCFNAEKYTKAISEIKALVQQIIVTQCEPRFPKCFEGMVSSGTASAIFTFLIRHAETQYTECELDDGNELTTFWAAKPEAVLRELIDELNVCAKVTPTDDRT